MKQQLPRSRPTNNQLLYASPLDESIKPISAGNTTVSATFRPSRYQLKLNPARQSLQRSSSEAINETRERLCVTEQHMQVLGILQRVESCHAAKRNILQILATNTRRTKVLELSSGTHRIPDELKKHYLTDEHGAQYSTNLDRNRYGSDNNYLFTVIKHDLETLGLCPCLADVEIIDAKAQGDSQLVTAGTETCMCTSRATAPPVQQPGAQGECSQLFEALVAAAADATEQAETDTAAQEVKPEMAEQVHVGHPGAVSAGVATMATAEHQVNGVIAASHHPAADGRMTPSPRKRRTPRRVPTGLFSVNSSDLMGCGFSNLGNSGLVVGDLDIDRKGEVDQRPSKKRTQRPGAEADTMSEQGDTDRYLKSVNAEAPDASEPWRHTRVPRQNSMVGAADVGVGITKDTRSLMGEIQHLQQNQGVMRSALETQKRTAAESELLIGQLQRGVQALHEDRTKLQRTLETTEKRVMQLEVALSSSNSEVAGIRKLVMALVSNDREAVAGILQQQHVRVVGTKRVDAPEEEAAGMLFPDNTAALEGEDHKTQENSRAGAMGVQHGTLSGPQLVAQKNHDMSVGVRAPGVEPLQLGQEDKKGPQLMNGAAPDKMVAQENRAAPTVGCDLPGQPGLGLPDGDTQVMPELGKVEDCEAIKKLPKFDNFGSLSDLGSLFSGGQGRSVDVRSGNRQPPRANVSITSPHPALAIANAKQNGADAKTLCNQCRESRH